MQQKKKNKGASRKKSGFSSFPIINKDAAGIDIGSEEHWVAVPEDRDEEPVRSFGCFTADLHAMAQWLKTCGITTVAMESTGVYWIPAHQILEQYGFEVFLVNARHVKNVPGRKSDVDDCQWVRASPYLRPPLRLVPSLRPDVRPAFLLAPQGEPHSLRRCPYPAHAEGADADEYPAA